MDQLTIGDIITVISVMGVAVGIIVSINGVFNGKLQRATASGKHDTVMDAKIEHLTKTAERIEEDGRAVRKDMSELSKTHAIHAQQISVLNAQMKNVEQRLSDLSGRLEGDRQ
jgi:peptidoglycan hydrolase CwlO-like protein